MNERMRRGVPSESVLICCHSPHCTLPWSAQSPAGTWHFGAGAGLATLWRSSAVGSLTNATKTTAIGTAWASLLNAKQGDHGPTREPGSKPLEREVRIRIII